MKKTKIFISLLLCLSFNIGISDELSKAVERKSNEVKNSIMQAKTSNTLWRDTQKIYDTAQQLIIEKDYYQSNLLLDEALYQLHASKQQAAAQSTDTIVPYYLNR